MTQCDTVATLPRFCTSNLAPHNLTTLTGGFHNLYECAVVYWCQELEVACCDYEGTLSCHVVAFFSTLNSRRRRSSHITWTYLPQHSCKPHYLNTHLLRVPFFTSRCVFIPSINSLDALSNSSTHRHRNPQSMAAQVYFLACLLAICLPIIFVQAPRFEIFREKQAENEAEKRSTVLSRSPPLRRIKRLSLEAHKEIKGNGSEQDQKHEQEQELSKLDEIARRRWHTRDPRPVFQGDASADSITSPHWTEELRRARADKKPRDRPFRR